jgi:hypothetical protein
MFMNGGKLFGKQFITPESIEKLFTAHIPWSFAADRFGIRSKEGYGYGWMIIDDFFGHKVVAHGGNTMVCSFMFVMIPDLKLGVCMAGNSYVASSVSTITPLMLLMQLLGKDPATVIPSITSEAKVAQLIGEYGTYKEIHNLKIVKIGGLLYLQPAKEPIGFGGFRHGDTLPLIPSENFMESGIFYIYTSSVDKTTVTFKPNASKGYDLLIAEWAFHQKK